MTNDQLQKVYELPESPEIDYIMLSHHKSSRTDISVVSVLGANEDAVKALISGALGYEQAYEHFSSGVKDGEAWRILRSFTHEIDLFIHLKEKAPAEAEENTHLDSSTLAEMSASIESEA